MIVVFVIGQLKVCLSVHVLHSIVFKYWCVKSSCCELIDNGTNAVPFRLMRTNRLGSVSRSLSSPPVGRITSLTTSSASPSTTDTAVYIKYIQYIHVH